MVGGNEHTKWMFQSPKFVHFCSKPLEILPWSLLLFFKRISGHLHLFDQWYSSERMRVFLFWQNMMLLQSKKRKVIFMADVICISIETIFVHQNLNILYVSVLYIFPRSFVNTFLCVLCWKMNWNTKVTCFELFIFLYVCFCLHYLSETTD